MTYACPLNNRNGMNERVLERLAERLQKCPIDEQLFASGLPIRLHLAETHSVAVSRRHRIAAPTQIHYRPETLFLCGHCMAFAAPSETNPISEIADHIKNEHPNTEGPISLRISVPTDSTLIDSFLENQATKEVCACNFAGCTEVFADEESVWRYGAPSAPPAKQSLSSQLNT